MGPGKRPDRNKCTEEDNLIRGSSGGCWVVLVVVVVVVHSTT